MMKRGSEVCGRENWHTIISLANQGCPDDLATMGCYGNCSNWLWEVIAILDGSTIQQTWYYCARNTSQASQKAVCWGAGEE